MRARWRRLLRSTTARFVAIAFLCQFAVTAGVLVFVDQAGTRAIDRAQKQAVADLRDELVDAYRTGGEEELRRLIRARLQAARGGAAVILLADRDGAPIAGNLGAWPTVVPVSTPWRAIDLYRMGSAMPEHMGVATTPLPGGERLLAGHVIDSGVRLARINEDAVLAALVAGLALATLSALAIGRLLSRQIGSVVDTAAAVGAGALGRRVPANGSGDAFDDLAQAINAMLERIEALVSQLRMMTDGLAHDLRSPVTRLKSTLEHAIVETRDPAALAALGRVADEADILLGMLSTALLISRTEAGMGREHLVPTGIAPLLADLAEVYGPLAEEHGFAIEVAAPSGLSIPLHRELMSQAIGNLIENALNYAEGGRRIVLGAAMEEGRHVAIGVGDDGPGIPPGRREEALRRFGRLDPARRVAGSGLGLSLVAAVARLHGGTIALEDNRPGLRVTLRLEADAGRGGDQDPPAGAALV